MSSLRDRDELIRLTAHNCDELQSALETLLYRMSFENRHFAALHNLDISKPDSIVLAQEAAKKLHSILEAPMIEGDFYVSIGLLLCASLTGLHQMSAVRHKTSELNKAADDFSRKFATQFNNAFTRQVQKLMTVSNSSPDKILGIHRVNRKDLIMSADFMAWMKYNRPKIFCDLQKVSRGL